MNGVESLSVRYHFRGVLEHDGKEWHYIGGRSGWSTVSIGRLSLEEMKRHLADHISISDEDLQNTTLAWRLVEKEKNLNFLCTLADNTTVNSMARHVTRVAAGYVDVYARMPDIASSEEEDEVDQQEIVEEEVCGDQQNIPVHGKFEEHLGHNQVEKVHEQYIVDQEMSFESENAGQIKLMKLPVVRRAMQDKGKEIQEHIAGEEAEQEDSSDSDYDVVHDADSEDSSADDDEAKCYREQAMELKKRVKRRMLGEEENKTANVPEEFIVPENINLDDGEGSDCFDTEDELSYDEDSDGEGNVRTRRTKHRVYDENAEVKEFELGQVFHDSREFKQALVNYGLKNFHHLLFPKDERTRVKAKCSWPTCNWSIYGSLVPNRSAWFTVSRYNSIHTCLPRRDNKLVTSTVIAEKYFREIKDNPGWRIEKMQEAVLEDMCAEVSESKCKRAKKTCNGEDH
jgi:hypothetical protein